jgi:phosphoribosylformimino-5-aminoimidazole carboxamide ribotide isomerase
VIVFPAMDLWNGEVVKLEAGRHRQVETVYGKPAEIARRWVGEGAEWLHVVDLNGTLAEGERNLPALRTIVASGARVQFGGGIRDDRTLEDALAAGVERAIVGTKAVRDWAWLAEAATRHPGKVMVSIDGKGRQILISGWQESAGVDVVEFIARAQELPIAGFLYTNVAVEGRGEGVDWSPVEEVVRASKRPVVFSGGVSTLDDVARFKSLGAYGMIAGSALYRSRFRFQDAQALAR